MQVQELRLLQKDIYAPKKNLEVLDEDCFTTEFEATYDYLLETLDRPHIQEDYGNEHG